MSTSSPMTTTGIALSRANLLLALVLLIQVGIATLVFWPQGDRAAVGAPLLSGITAADVTSLTITNDRGETLQLTRAADGWAIANTDDFPATAQKVEETLTKLFAMTTDRLVTQTAASHDRLQVGETTFQRKIDLTTASGTTTLFLGSSAGAGATHVRLAGQDAAYLNGGLATWELDTLLTSWINVSYVSIATADIQRVTLTNAQGAFDFVREGDGWTLADRAPDETILSANISTLVSRLATLNLHSPLGQSDRPEYGMAAPLATLTVVYTDTTSVTQSLTLTIGAKDDATNTYAMKSSASPYFARVSAFTADEFVNKARGDFLPAADTAPAADAPVPPLPTPQPEAEPTPTP